MKIVRKGQNSRDVSPLFKQQADSAKDGARARALKELLEANARWNQTRRDTSANDLRRIVDETSTINPELRKERLYSWERGFIEDKPEDSVSQEKWSPILLRNDEGRRSGKALTKPLKLKLHQRLSLLLRQLLGQSIVKVTLPKPELSFRIKKPIVGPRQGKSLKRSSKRKRNVSLKNKKNSKIVGRRMKFYHRTKKLDPEDVKN